MSLKLWPLFIGDLLLLASTARADAEGDCGGYETPCKVEKGLYRAALPEHSAGVRVPLVLWLHGYAGSGARAIANQDLVALITGRGYALVAASGQDDISRSGRLDWNVDDGVDLPRDDVAHLQAVLADAIRRFDLDGNRVLVAGFSRGG